MAKTFVLTDYSEKKAKEFEEAHMHKDISKGAIGGHISYIFTPTSIGDGISIKCSVCGAEKNITDYKTW